MAGNDQHQAETMRYLIELLEPKRELFAHALNISNSLLSGSNIIDIPFDDCKYVAVVNSTPAVLSLAPGENYMQDPAAVVVAPYSYLSYPMVNAKKLTVFWDTGSLISIDSNNNVNCTILFSNMPIPLDNGIIQQNRQIINTDGTANVNIANATVAVPQDIQSIYRVMNFSTTTLLAASATYTGPSIDALQFRRITGLVNSAQAGNLYVDESDDGTNWLQVATQAVTAATPYAYDYTLHGRYIRIRYTNGATAQTSFSLSGYMCVQ